MQKIKKIIKALLVLAVCIVVLFCWIFSRIPEGGVLLSSSASLDGEYTVNVYLHENSLSADAVRCEVVNSNHERARNIYWNYPESTAKIQWMDDDTVSINGIVLDVRTDKYDFRWD